MIAFIIPIIHPDHNKIVNYHDISICLKRTINNLLQQSKTCIIIIVCNKYPFKCKLFGNRVTFLIGDNYIFKLLYKLDDQTLLLENIPNNSIYKSYLKMRGQFHNKDKGLKYFIGLLYCFNCSKTQYIKYIGLIDGDDFININLNEILNRIPEDLNLFIVSKGYLMISTNNSINNTNKIYKLSNFSNLCGTNRFFRKINLEQQIKKRLNYKITPKIINNLINSNKITNNLIYTIFDHIGKTTPAWTILPNFFGVHRIILQTGYYHPFNNKFRIYEIPNRVAIKYIHNSNHSNIDKKENIVERYKIKSFIEKDDNGDLHLNNIIKQYGVIR